MDIKLTSKVILEKEFKKSVKGYNIDQVDQFLDQIMEDYDKFEEVLSALKAENERLKEELAGSSKKPVTPPNTNNMNYDIIKRLANLEKAVFGDKLRERL
jgi:DivIVA domain-containing protein